MPEAVSDGLFDVPGVPMTSGHDLGASAGAPLAVRMRPASLDEVVGQDHLLAPGSPLRRLVEGSGVASVILYGPPGSGKTTLAALISQATGRRFEALSALSAGVKEVRAVIENSRKALLHGEQTVLFIDEVHRFSKTQQDALLSAVEHRVVLLVAATTENPSFSVVAPLLSRSLILQLRPLTAEDTRAVVQRAIDDPRGLGRAVAVAPEAVDLLVQLAAGDARRALTALEVAAEAAQAAGELVSVQTIERSVDKAAVRYDRDGRPALRRRQRLHQIGARFRRRCRAALFGPHAGRRGGPAVHRPPADDSGQRGHRHGRPERAAGGGRRRTDGGADRHARSPADAGARHHPPGHRTEVKRRHHGVGRGDERHQGRQGRSGAGSSA